MLVLFLLSACKDAPDKVLPDTCETAPAEVFASGFTRGTEGVAFAPDGRLFVSGDDRVMELDDEGGVIAEVDVAGALGLAWWHDQLAVAGSEGLSLVEGDRVELLAGGFTDVPNFVAVTAWDTLLVSDDFVTDIFEVTAAGRVEKWLDIPSPNGMVFVGDDLYVATTFENPAPIWRVPIANQRPGTPEVVVEYPGGNVPDGLAADDNGNVYVALNVAGRIERIGPDGSTELVGEVPFTASLAFDPLDRCRMVSTSLFGTEVWELRP